jgi:hypothetical protein
MFLLGTELNGPWNSSVFAAVMPFPGKTPVDIPMLKSGRKQKYKSNLMFENGIMAITRV